MNGTGVEHIEIVGVDAAVTVHHWELSLCYSFGSKVDRRKAAAFFVMRIEIRYCNFHI